MEDQRAGLLLPGGWRGSTTPSGGRRRRQFRVTPSSAVSPPVALLSCFSSPPPLSSPALVSWTVPSREEPRRRTASTSRSWLVPALRTVGLQLLLLVSLPAGSMAQCHNRCSGHGECNTYSRCECWTGWEGADCSLRPCPSGPAWADYASAADTAHGDAPCSNMGHCDSSTGLCTCEQGYGGMACERAECPNGCNGHGECVSMASAASRNDGFRLNRTSEYTHWDAGKIHGCLCDLGYSGFDCSEKACVEGDNPITIGQQDEKALLFCQCASTCSGSFKLSYRGEYAKVLPSYTEEDVAKSLTALRTINFENGVEVSFSDSQTSVCSETGTTTSITFTGHSGDLPPLYIKAKKLASSNVSATPSVYMVTALSLVCVCGDSCGGWFRFRSEDGVATDRLPWDAGSALIESRLADLSLLSAENITISMGAGGVCADSSTVVTNITLHKDHGNVPLLVVPSLTQGGEQLAHDEADLGMWLRTNEGTKEATACCGGGQCDYDVGTCTCDPDWGYAEDYGPCGQFLYSSSQWPGRQTCPGLTAFADGEIYWDAIEGKNEIFFYFTDEGKNATEDDDYTTFSSGIDDPGVYWYVGSKGQTAEAFSNVSSANATNAIALDMTYRRIYWGEGNVIYQMTVPSDIEAEYDFSLYHTAPKTVFAELALEDTVGYIELDLRPDYRYAYWTVPGRADTADGKIQRKQLSNGTDSETFVEDLSDVIRANLQALGKDLVTPRGLALDLQQATLYVVDEMLEGAAGETDGLVMRCHLDDVNSDGSGNYSTEIALDFNLSDPRAIALDLIEGNMLVTDVYKPALFKADMYNYSKSVMEMELLATGAINTRFGEEQIEEYVQPFVSPQSIQLDGRDPSNTYFLTDFGTGWMYKGSSKGGKPDLELELGAPRSFIIDFALGYPTYSPYQECYGHGRCSGQPYFDCECHTGWFGNCLMRTCPSGPAWFDEARSDGSAHRHMECSNAGKCDRSTGECVCHTGHEGGACERHTCPGFTETGSYCSGHGQCLTMRQLALLATDSDLNPAPVSYGSTANASATWDADQMMGCHCATSGYTSGAPSYHNASDWTGYDCSLRSCPTGDDPKLYYANESGVLEPPLWEKQNLTCTGQNGSFELGFRQATTGSIDANGTVGDLKEALEGMWTLGAVDLAGEDEEGPVCTVDGSGPIAITFKTELGDVPLLRVLSEGGDSSPSVVVTETTRGSKLDLPCSDHGLCDSATGVCECFGGWGSSDGDGNIGHRNDCGFHSEGSD